MQRNHSAMSSTHHIVKAGGGQQIPCGVEDSAGYRRLTLERLEGLEGAQVGGLVGLLSDALHIPQCQTAGDLRTTQIYTNKRRPSLSNTLEPKEHYLSKSHEI